jgi:hypothetical protein
MNAHNGKNIRSKVLRIPGSTFFSSTELRALTASVQSHTSPSSNGTPPHLSSLSPNHHHNNNMSPYSQQVPSPLTSTPTSTIVANKNNNYLSKNVYNTSLASPSAGNLTIGDHHMYHQALSPPSFTSNQSYYDNMLSGNLTADQKEQLQTRRRRGDSGKSGEVGKKEEGLMENGEFNKDRAVF